MKRVSAKSYASIAIGAVQVFQAAVKAIGSTSDGSDETCRVLDMTSALSALIAPRG